MNYSIFNKDEYLVAKLDVAAAVLKDINEIIHLPVVTTTSGGS